MSNYLIDNIDFKSREIPPEFIGKVEPCEYHSLMFKGNLVSTRMNAPMTLYIADEVIFDCVTKDSSLEHSGCLRAESMKLIHKYEDFIEGLVTS